MINRKDPLDLPVATIPHKPPPTVHSHPQPIFTHPLNHLQHKVFIYGLSESLIILLVRVFLVVYDWVNTGLNLANPSLPGAYGPHPPYASHQ
jgi:hypothetical protein